MPEGGQTHRGGQRQKRGGRRKGKRKSRTRTPEILSGKKRPQTRGTVRHRWKGKKGPKGKVHHRTEKKEAARINITLEWPNKGSKVSKSKRASGNREGGRSKKRKTGGFSVEHREKGAHRGKTGLLTWGLNAGGGPRQPDLAPHETDNLK